MHGYHRGRGGSCTEIIVVEGGHARQRRQGPARNIESARPEARERCQRSASRIAGGVGEGPADSEEPPRRRGGGRNLSAAKIPRQNGPLSWGSSGGLVRWTLPDPRPLGGKILFVVLRRFAPPPEQGTNASWTKFAGSRALRSEHNPRRADFREMRR